MHSSGSMKYISSPGRVWMHSTGQTSAQEPSFTPTHGSVITYVMRRSPLSYADAGAPLSVQLYVTNRHELVGPRGSDTIDSHPSKGSSTCFVSGRWRAEARVTRTSSVPTRSHCCSTPACDGLLSGAFYSPRESHRMAYRACSSATS